MQSGPTDRGLQYARAKITVKNGAEDLTVSVKETATNLSETRPSMIVTKRISPTASMSHMKLLVLCELTEWTPFVRHEFGLKRAEAAQAFEAWDLDRSKGEISTAEFERMLAHVIRIKNYSRALRAKLSGSASYTIVKSVVSAAVASDLGLPCNEKLGGVATFKELQCMSAFGCCCCLCTACLSWCPYCCAIVCIRKNLEAPLRKVQSEEVRDIKAKLLDGPGAPKTMDRM